MLKIIFQIILAIFISDLIITKITKGKVSIFLIKIIPVLINFTTKVALKIKGIIGE